MTEVLVPPYRPAGAMACRPHWTRTSTWGRRL